MIFLGIESSCDETAAALIEVKNKKIKVLTNIISSQIELHKKYGGVIPELAAREHVLSIIPVINQCLKKAGLQKNDKKITAIVATAGPGLITSLMCGFETAKTLAYLWKKPFVGINHIEGHIYSNFANNEKIGFPALALTASGGHTILVLLKQHLKYKIIGETRDDAVGEAFDKAAQLLKLGYPGGPIISKLAEKGQAGLVKLPRPMINEKSFDFSFSGLKTALLYQLQKNKNWPEKIPDYCAEFQQAAIDVLIKKTILAANKFKVKTVLLSGGVSANKELRKQLKENVEKNLKNTKFSMPKLEYTTDNAVMIAVAGYFKYLNIEKTKNIKNINPNLNL